MVGQNKVLQDIQNLIENNMFPRFSIITGRKGSGKKTLAKEISKRLGYDFVLWTNKIDDIRELIDLMWQQDKPTVYCIPEYEDMSLGARNSILKVCEEPPNNSIIILTSASREIIIPTILGRGTVFEMSAYTEEELFTIEKAASGAEDSKIDKIIKLCEVPGDLEIAKNTDCDAFVEFLNMFWENIGKSSPGNALKVVSKLKIKEDSAGNTLFDIGLFINYLARLNAAEPVTLQKSKIFREISDARRGLQLKYNKLFIIDNLILNIRSIKNGTI